LADPASQRIVPLQLWREHRAGLLASGRPRGVGLDSGGQAQPLEGSQDTLALVALHVPQFVDGRPYSTAVSLRRQYGYSGELRAIGDVLRDQLFYMKRCGFSSFELEETVKLEDARRAFADFRDNYQSTVEEPVPLFRRKERHGLSLQD